jgi:hypothetical protein
MNAEKQVELLVDDLARARAPAETVRILRHIRGLLWAILIVLLLLWSGHVLAAPRSHAAKAAFQRETPCPATGATRGGCPGHVIDHVVPLCAGGPDAPTNMQWQTVDDAKVKDREEAKLCRSLRRA